ncbi:MAG: hypothetical protein JKY96_05300 [Phycisphaerales bacterium]|nr:hypothetical protein [Phycisphaerales bacterium]
MYTLDLTNVDVVVDALMAGADACLNASCRLGSIDFIEAPGQLIATGDTHDHPLNFKAVLSAAGLDGEFGAEQKHLTLHEIIHPELSDDQPIDYSFRGLTRIAYLKSQHPDLVHVLLANHELAQAIGSGIMKNGLRVVDAFNAGVDEIFGSDAERVHEAIRQFVFAMPLALRCRCPHGDILCAHSLPGPAMMGRFDPSILERDMTMDDYQPRVGSAHMMVWGRGYDSDQLEDLTERWGVNLFLLGHEHAPKGYAVVEPNAIVLNTDHNRGVYLPIDLDDEVTVDKCISNIVPIGSRF